MQPYMRNKNDIILFLKNLCVQQNIFMHIYSDQNIDETIFCV